MKAFWEVVTHCPHCGAEWVVDPDAQIKMIKKVALIAAFCAALSFLPLLGFLFGLAGTGLGILVFRLTKHGRGLAGLVISVVVGLGGQSYLAYWAYGYFTDRACQSNLTTLANSIYAYRTLSQTYPGSLKDMINLRLNVPTQCPVGGGKYIYAAPIDAGPASRTAVASGPTTAQVAASQANTPEAITPEARPPQASASQATTANAAASMPASAPAVWGDDKTLIVAEALPEHRTERMCITSDLTVHGIPHAQFDQMLTLPQNKRMAAALDKAYRASTQPKEGKGKKGEGKPAESPAE